jgi:hypothetical protein
MKGPLNAAILGTALLLASTAIAQVYKSTDDQGNVVFSDTPPAGSSDSQQVDIPRTNTSPPPPVIAPVPRPTPEAPETETVPVEVAITSPANESTIPMGGGIFTVSASVSGGDSSQVLQLLMDGSPQGEPQQTGSWNLENVLRGPHDLVVEARSRDGKVLARSEPVRVYVLRPSVR